jgi:ADP-ribose pyrophosphatase YjhB (NUDIX family)
MDKTLGVIIGDFQCAKLNDGYCELIDFVLKQNHTQTIIFLRVSNVVSKKNPLSDKQRHDVIREKYPYSDYDLWIFTIRDEPSIKGWSKTLDDKIKKECNLFKLSPYNTVIYGLQLIPQKGYCGKFTVSDFIPKKNVNNNYITINYDDLNESFRRGVIYSSNQRFDTMYQTIDVVIFSYLSIVKEECKIVVGKKKIYGDDYILVGGFVDPLKDKNLRDACIREVFEETNLQISTPIYVDSFVTDDYRYRYENDKIMTHLHYTIVEDITALKANDDLCSVEVIELTTKNIEKIRPAYRKMVEMVEKRLKELNMIQMDKTANICRLIGYR